MKKTLFEITGDALAIYENLEENGGELTEELNELFCILAALAEGQIGGGK